ALLSATFGLIFPPAIVAIVVLMGIAAYRPRQETRQIPRANARPIRQLWAEHRAAHLTMLAYLGSLFFAATLVHVHARYRLMYVPIVICCAVVFVAIVVRSLAAGRPSAAIALIAAAVGVFAWQRHVSAARLGLDRRAADRIVVAERYTANGNAAAAAPFL